jgi:hypothetical protein
MTVIDGMVWINEIDSWVSTQDYKEYVEHYEQITIKNG